MLATNSYEWVLEADIKACFDEISHVAVQDRLRARVGDKRVMSLIKAFLKAGIMTELAAKKRRFRALRRAGYSRR
jgi:RNA-directed DNA polymerase